MDDSESDPDGVARVLDRIWVGVERIRLEFDSWSDPSALGPGLYFVIERESVADFVTPLGTNRWPVEDCASVFADIDSLVESARSVGFSNDGAVVVNSDGTIEEEMVRLTQLAASELEPIDGLPYADWMGTRHMSALETSTREEVAAVVTLSEEDGRMTIFTGGTFQTHHRQEVE